MWYLGIDQHARQLTISLRDDHGDVLQARQVSTQPERIHAFFQQLTRERLHHGECFVAMLEVCGFNDWLIRMLQDYHCHKVILIQPDDRKKCKTDRRDAAALSELLWVDREHLLPRILGAVREAELHWLRHRLLGGKLARAEQGELRMRPPAGLVFDAARRRVLDPDEEVQQAVRLSKFSRASQVRASKEKSLGPSARVRLMT